jgi:hypothetical protein
MLILFLGAFTILLFALVFFDWRIVTVTVGKDNFVFEYEKHRLELPLKVFVSNGGPGDRKILGIGNYSGPTAFTTVELFSGKAPDGLSLPECFQVYLRHGVRRAILEAPTRRFPMLVRPKIKVRNLESIESLFNGYASQTLVYNLYVAMAKDVIIVNRDGTVSGSAGIERITRRHALKYEALNRAEMMKPFRPAIVSISFLLIVLFTYGIYELRQQAESKRSRAAAERLQVETGSKNPVPKDSPPSSASQ